MSKVVNFNNFEELFMNLNSNDLVSDKLLHQFFEFVPNLFNYEEEGEKLNFDILFIDDLDSRKHSLPSYLFQSIASHDEKNLNIKKIIKSIAPFSLNGWNMYISIAPNKYEFGIYKNFGGVDSLDIDSILSKNEFIEIIKMDKNKLLFRNSLDNFTLHISVLKEEKYLDKKKNIITLVENFTSEVTHEYKQKFIKSISNSLFHNMEKIHGTIIIIQDKNIQIDDFVQKGILFDTPINLFEEYLNYITNCSMDENIAERYYSFTGILSMILNIDGITMINNSGEILGYNIFIDNKDVDTSSVTGGARKRAAFSIENSKVNGLIGMYFQSHDGDNYYKDLT